MPFVVPVAVICPVPSPKQTGICLSIVASMVTPGTSSKLEITEQLFASVIVTEYIPSGIPEIDPDTTPF